MANEHIVRNGLAVLGSIYGSASSGGDMQLLSTLHGTKGNILLGTTTPVSVDDNGVLTVQNATGSTSKDTGSVIIEGGVGIEEKLYVGSNVLSGTFGGPSVELVSNTAGANVKVYSSDTANTYIEIGQFGGNTGQIAFNPSSDWFQINAVWNVTDGTDNTLGNVSTGSLRTAGGLGVQGNATVGGSLEVNTDLIVNGYLWFENAGSTVSTFVDEIAISLSGASTDQQLVTAKAVYDEIQTVTGGSVSTLGGTSTDNALARFNGTDGTSIQDYTATPVLADDNGVLTVQNTTTSTSKDTGALIVEGGVGIEENLNVGGSIDVDGNLTVQEAFGFTDGAGATVGTYVDEISTTISVASTDDQLPTAKAVYDALTGSDSYLELTDTPGSFTASSIPFTNTGASALLHSSNLTFNDGTGVLSVTGSTGALLSVRSSTGVDSTIRVGDNDSYGDITYDSSNGEVIFTGSASNTNWYVKSVSNVTLGATSASGASLMTDGGAHVQLDLNVNGNTNINGYLRFDTNANTVNEVTTTVNGSSTDDQLPTALAVWNALTGSDTYLELTDTPADFSVNGAIPYESSDALVHNSALVFNGTTLTTTGLTLSSGDFTLGGNAVNDILLAADVGSSVDTALVTAGYVDAEVNAAVSGTSGQVAYFNGTNSVTSEAGFEYNAGTDTLTVANISATGNVTITGDLTVNGTTTTVDTETVLVEDNFMTLNNGEVGAGVTAGFAGLEIDRGTLTNYGIIFDDISDTFRIGEFDVKSAADTILTDNTQAVATREDAPNDNGIAFWDATNNLFETDSNLTWDGSNLDLTGQLTYNGLIANFAVEAAGTADGGTDTIDSFTRTDGFGAVWQVVVRDGTNFRISTVRAIWNQSGTVSYDETSTTDIGDTSAVTLSVADDTSNIDLNAVASSGTWTIEVVRTLI